MEDKEQSGEKDISILRDMCKSIPHVAFSVDRDGLILCCNEKAEQLTGIKEDELRASRLIGVVDFSEKASEADLSRHIKEGSLINSLELYCKFPGGHEGWFDISIAGFPNNENISKLLVIFRPVVRRKHEEAELLLTKRRYENLLSNLPGMVYSCDFDRSWTMQFVSDGCKDLTGYEPQDFIDNKVVSFADIIHPDYREYLFAEWKANIQKRIPTQVEYPIITKDGVEKWVWEQGKPVYGPEGNLLALEGVIMDTTARRNIEKERSESQKRFRTIFEKSPVAMALNSSTGKMLAVNRKFTESLGYTLEDVSDLDYWWPKAYPDPDYREEVKQNWNILLSGMEEEEYDMEPHNYKVVNKRGEEMIIEFLVSKIGDDYLIIFNDITERTRSIEEINRAMQKAEESDKLKSAFLANMSHEIRTPMNGILGFLDLLKGDDLDYRTRLKYMEIVNNSANNLLTIINSIIDISKIEAGVEKVFLESFPVNDVITEVVSLMKILAESKGLAFHSKTDDTVGLMLYSDMAKVRQILINLISNGIKFTEKGEVEVISALKDGHLNLIVRDSGIGISPDQTESVFDRFRQAELSSAKKYGGTGLGLAISKSYANMVGGNITVESELGVGTKFTVILPLSVK